MRYSWVLLFCVLSAPALASGDSEECREHLRRQPAPASPDSLRSIHTVVSEQGILSLGVTARGLVQIADIPRPLGRSLEPDVELYPLKTAFPAQNLTQVAALQRRANAPTLLAWISQGSVQVGTRKQGVAREVDLTGDGWPLSVAWIPGDPPRLAVVTSKGIFVGTFAQEQVGRVLHMEPHLVGATIKGGTCFASATCVFFDAKGTVWRTTPSGKPVRVGAVPGATGLTGFQRSNQLALWVTDSNDRFWEWEAVKKRFVPAAFSLPEGVFPLQMVASAGVIPKKNPNPAYWVSGYYSKKRGVRTELGKGVRLERLWILGSDREIYSPFSVEGAAQKLEPMRTALSADEVFGKRTLRKLLGTNFWERLTVSPAELGLKDQELAEDGYLLRQRQVLLTSWLERLEWARWIETPESGVQKKLNWAGVPKDTGSRLIFLGSLGAEERDKVFFEKGYSSGFFAAARYSKILLKNPHYVRILLENDQRNARRGLLQFFHYLPGNPATRLEHFTGWIEEHAPNELGGTTYEALVKWLRIHDPLWEW